MAPEDSTENEDGLGVADGNHAQYSEEQPDAIPHDPNVSGDVQLDEESDDGGDYDPESVAIDTTPAPAADTVPRASSKPKMTGGFIVEASDDEDDATPQPRADPQTQLQPHQPTGSSTGTPALAVGKPSSAPPPVAGIDPVTLLEARIKEDARGDMDAWLNLMADYRMRSNLDGLREVYHRFLEVFPQAVCISLNLFFS
jgi:cleavage stimulation factor subunit 3